MLKKHDLGITPYIENISSRDQSLVKMGTSRVTLDIVQIHFQHVNLKVLQEIQPVKTDK